MSRTEAYVEPSGFVDALRLAHWTKNFLVFAPLLLGGLVSSPKAWLLACLTFAAFCLAASGSYLLNDVFDRRTDGQHVDKCHRPIARGVISPSTASISAGFLVAGALIIALAVSLSIFVLIGLYLAISAAYTLYLKRLRFVDCAVLATLLCLRLLAGDSAVQTPISIWLFLVAYPSFFSLALAKRYTEFANSNGRSIPGRSYTMADFRLISRFGLGSAILAAGILLGYVAAGIYDHTLYVRPTWLWATPVILMIGLLRVWQAATNRLMRSDPLIYAWQDPVSIALAATMVAIFIIAVG